MKSRTWMITPACLLAALAIPIGSAAQNNPNYQPTITTFDGPHDADGTYPSPGATLSVTSLMFPGQNVGTTSAALTVWLTNSGGAALNVTDIDTTAHFAERDNCVGSLVPATSCEINITFTPSTTGSLTGMLLVTDNASGSPQAVNLSGTGIISHYELTGVCLVPFYIVQRCHLIAVQDLTQCPAGLTANEPVREEGCLFLPSSSPLEDLSRSCHAGSIGHGGVCEAK